MGPPTTVFVGLSLPFLAALVLKVASCGNLGGHRKSGKGFRPETKRRSPLWICRRLVMALGERRCRGASGWERGQLKYPSGNSGN
jgi:hypothetical protein